MTVWAGFLEVQESRNQKQHLDLPAGLCVPEWMDSYVYRLVASVFQTLDAWTA
jgi:hypothetical protein